MISWSDTRLPPNPPARGAARRVSALGGTNALYAAIADSSSVSAELNWPRFIASSAR